uniref:Glyoxysomal fatty acid beta-oxidation multifunctional protein MFP-a-like n=1 Tax=Rhizophora mucronata TaxID=61149 RepID=A0A2P2KUQ4_RHIMU
MKGRTTIEVGADGVALITIINPPVNSLSVDGTRFFSFLSLISERLDLIFRLCFQRTCFVLNLNSMFYMVGLLLKLVLFSLWKFLSWIEICVPW